MLGNRSKASKQGDGSRSKAAKDLKRAQQLPKTEFGRELSGLSFSSTVHHPKTIGRSLKASVGSSD